VGSSFMEARRAIERKRDGFELSPAEVRGLVDGYLRGEVLEEQMASALMAGYFRGWSFGEIEALTRAYVESGRVLTLPRVGLGSGFGGRAARTVDKHSTGGVGDAVSLIVVPWVAACGAPVAKLSGRALAHTGGTIDKLEAVPGLRTELSADEFAGLVAAVGCAIGAAGPDLAPADKRIYALRDRCGSVPSMGLIAASVVSKKIAGGAEAIVFDVKVGSGAFMRTRAEALELARMMVSLARRFERSALALVTDMEEPLGTHVGTGLEVLEALAFLRGPALAASDARLAECCRAVAGAMLALSLGIQESEALQLLEQAVSSGTALARFEALVRGQGGSWEALLAMRPAEPCVEVVASRAGFVERVDPVGLGELARALVSAGGALAGVVVVARVGDWVTPGAVLARLHGVSDAAGALHGAAAAAESPAARAARCFAIGDAEPPERPMVYERVV